MDIVVNPQKRAPSQDRKTIASLVPACLFDAQNLPHRFHPCLAFRAWEHWEEDL